MASTTSSTNSAVQPAVSSGWLTIDTTAAQAGYGPAVPPGPDLDTVTPVPVGQSPLNPESPIRVPAAEGVQYAPEGEGPWPYLPDGGLVPQPPVQRQQDGVPQGGYESLVPPNTFPGQWNSYNAAFPGFDAQAQVTDNEGWKQNIPTGRVASWNTFGQATPVNVSTWYDFGERPVQPHYAVAATDFTSGTEQGQPGITDGSLPDWSLLGGQGNTVYETPGPPATTEPDSSGSLIEMGWA
jgi:hypothetical protein